MRVFITGVDGFLGLRLSRRLLEVGHEVAGLVLDQPAALERGVSPAVSLTEGDLLALEALGPTIESFGPDYVVHLAGLSHVGQSWQAMARYFHVNVLGTENILHASRCPVLFASSSEVYGQIAPELLPVEETAPVAPSSPYALCKAAAERLAVAHRAVVVRMFNLVGPGQSPDFALPSFARQLAAIQSGDLDGVLRVGNLSAQRDFVHVDDAADAFLVLMERAERGEIYNLATGSAIELRQALQRLIAIAGVEARIEQDPALTRPVDTPVVCGNPGKLAELGWTAQRDLDRALSDLWQAVIGD